MVGGLSGGVPSTGGGPPAEATLFPAWIEYKFTPGEINHPYRMRALCVRIVKIKCVWHRRCFHFLSLHTCGTFLLGSVRVSCSEIPAMDTSTCCTNGTVGRREGGAGGERGGWPVLTRGSNSCQGTELWVMTFYAMVGLSVFIPKPADTRPKESADSLMCLQHNLQPRSLSLLFLPSELLPPTSSPKCAFPACRSAAW